MTTLIDEIDIRRADLVLMATHGRSGPGRWVHGSVADAVLRDSPVPVVLISPNTTRAWSIDRPPTILVPLDGSELSEAGIGPAGALASAVGARLVLLRVEQAPPAGAYGEPAVYPAFDPQADVDAAKQYLTGVAARLHPSVCEAHIRVEFGQPAPTIVRVADEEQADFISMATHGRSGLARLVLGSVAARVLQHASVPLVLIRPSVLKAHTVVHEADSKSAASEGIATDC